MIKDGVPSSVCGDDFEDFASNEIETKNKLIYFAAQGIITIDYRLEVRYGLFILR